MTDLDRRIEEALKAEDRAILEPFEEMGLMGQFRSLFSGKAAWMSVVTLIIGTTVTVFGFYAAWKFATVADVSAILRWGGLAWALFVTQMMIKLWSWMRMEHNRTIREIKRLELQIALMQQAAGR